MYYPNAMEVNFVPETSLLNSSGLCEMVYTNEPVSNTMRVGPNPNMKQAELTLYPFYTAKSLRDSSGVRAIRIPAEDDLETTLFMDSTTGQAAMTNPKYPEYFYLLFTGAVASKTIGRVYVNFSCEFVPTA